MFEKSSQCTQEVYLGYAPASYFVIGVFEVLFSTFVAIIMFKRSYFPSLSRSQYVSYILPIYVSTVVPLLFVCFLIGVHSIVGIYVTNTYLLIAKWYVLRFLSESLSIFFMHVGIGLGSALNSLRWGLLWTSLNVLIEVVVFAVFGLDGLLISSLVIILELLFTYCSFLLIPLEKLHRRPALYRYSIANIVLLMYQGAAVIGYMSSTDNSAASCSIEMNFSICEFLQVLAILYAFYRDSKFWQGLYVDAKANLNEPLLGIWDMNREAVNLVTDSVIQLERKVVNIIPFSQLKVDTSTFFSGGSARVYKGTYYQNEVAIKFLFCIELTPGRIVEFCKEAAMLNSLQHPNIVKCYGVAIMPPAISLVSEYCTYGSLFDFLHSTDLIMNNDSHNRSSSVNRTTALRVRTETGETIESAGSERRVYAQSTSKLFKGSAIAENSARQSAESSYPSSAVGDLECGYASQDDSHNESTFKCTINPMTLKAPVGRNRSTEVVKETRKSTDTQSSDLNKIELLKYLDPENTGNVDSSDVASKLADAMGTNGPYSLASSFHVSSELIMSGPSKRSNAATGTSQLPWYSKSMSHRFTTGNPSEAPPSTIKLKSPASVMLTREMGFGLGPISLSKPRDSNSAARRVVEISAHQNRSISCILSAGVSSMQSIGNLLPLSVRIQMIRDCCAGLSYLHSKGIMHCDIKSLNFLVASNLTVKLADLGEAIVVKDIDREKQRFPTNINWSSPETLTMDTANIDFAADVWSLGMVIHEIISGEVPFDNEEFRALKLEDFLGRLKEGARPPMPKDYRHISWLKELMDRAWEFQPSQRISAAEILESVSKYI